MVSQAFYIFSIYVRYLILILYHPRYEENKLMTRFAVTATCGEAYEGVAQVSMCKEPGEPFRGGFIRENAVFHFKKCEA